MVITQIADMLAGGPALWFAEGIAPALDQRVGAVVQTSGSTGVARRVVLSRQAIIAAAAATRARQGTDLTWHLALPHQYVAGLMVVVRSLAAGREVPQAGTDLSRLHPTGEGDAISLVPTQLHRALTSPDIVSRLRAFDIVLLGGAPLTAELHQRAQDAGIQVVTSYGMSETCGGVCWDGYPLPGVSVELRQERVAVQGPMLFDGYLAEPMLTAATLREGWLLTKDRGIVREGRLEIVGRVDDVIISGGVNVDLAQVRAEVNRIDADAAVIAVSDEEWGQRVVVVSVSGDLSWWRDSLAQQLPREWLPRQVIHARVPLTAGGKPDRAALMALITE